MIDDRGNKVKEALPSIPIEILGFDSVRDAGDFFFIMKNEKEAKKLIEKKREVLKLERHSRKNLITLEDWNQKIKNGEQKEFNIIIKVDVRGSVETLRDSIERLGNNEIKINIILDGVGILTESDIMFSAASNAIIVLFNLEIKNNIKIIAQKEGVEIRSYNIIYEAIDEIKSAMEGLLSPIISQDLIGRAEVRQIINIPKMGFIAGCMVIEGEINKNNTIKVIRDEKEIFNGKINNLKRFKENVEKVEKGYECGISIEKFNNYKVGDILENYIEKKY